MLQAQDIVRIHSHDNYHCVFTADGTEYSAMALLITTGSHYRRLNVTGESSYIGAGVHFCATCDGPFYKGKKIVVVGGGNSAVEESLLLRKFADSVTILVRGDAFTASQIVVDEVMADPKIDIMWNTEVVEFLGTSSKLNTVKLHNNKTGEDSILAIYGAFIFIGLTPNTAFLDGSGVILNEWGFIETGHALFHDGRVSEEPGIVETNIPGIFAAGDVRAGSTKQVASATGEGATAALLIREHLKTV